MDSFLRWAGGKRWFISKYVDLIPKKFNRYFEPFLGSGSVFFHLAPSNAFLGDLNNELVSAFQAIKDDWITVYNYLIIHHKNHNKNYYYQIRANDSINTSEKAARFIYLNRTCFNGIYRVNSQGRFNVPKGTMDAVILEKDNFELISSCLAKAELRKSDFESLITDAQNGDLIFADPPYTVRHNNNGFISYNEKLFSWEDQIRLADTLNKAKERGVKVVLTNANNHSIRELYENNGFLIKTVSRYSSISALPQNRKQFEELVILANQD
jgi:DNA adenine methylase